MEALGLIPKEALGFGITSFDSLVKLPFGTAPIRPFAEMIIQVSQLDALSHPFFGWEGSPLLKKTAEEKRYTFF